MPDVLACSFCGHTKDQARKLIAGPSVVICDACVELCNEILVGEDPAWPWQRTSEAPAGLAPALGGLDGPG